MISFIRSNAAAPRVAGLAAAAAVFTFAVAPLQGQGSGGKHDSVVVRDDPVVIIDGGRISQGQFDKLQGATAQIEILRGRLTVPFGDDAEGGVIRITVGDSASLARLGSGGGAAPSYGLGGRPAGMPSGMGGMGSMGGGGGGMSGSMGGMGGMGGLSSGRGGMDGSSPMDAGRSAPTMSASAVSGPPIYPIIVINGMRVTDDSLYKVKAKMMAALEVLAPEAAMAKYGKDAAAGAIVMKTIKIKPAAKPATKSSAKTPKKTS